LTMRLMIFSIGLLLFGAVGMSLGQSLNDLNDETIIGDSAESIFVGDANETGNAVNLNYIWAVMGLESGQVIMALNQENKNLYGAAKYEPDGGQSWNAIVVGSISGDDAEIVLTTITGDEISSFKMTGIFDAANQSLKGSFFRVSKDKISEMGNFEATWINPDTFSYIPATIEEPEVTAIAPSDAASAIVANATDLTYQQQPSQTSRFHDVRDDADRILTGVGDLSQIPIGMGGSGLGGGSGLS
jgi:hypothetical protein